MDNTNFLKRDLDDIVFEGRNQSYGAYVIRKKYTSYMQRASMLGFAFFGLLIASPSIAESMRNRMAHEDNTVVELTTLPPPPDNKPIVPKPPEPPKPEPPKPIATVRYVSPKVEEDEKVKQPDNLPPMEDIKAAVSTVDRDGTNEALPPDMTPAPPPEAPEGNGKKEVKEEEDKPFIIVEQVPEFPDGLKAMYLFLRDNIKYPAVARENNIEGNVFVGFVVGKDGAIRDIIIKRGIGGGCNEEAMRVVGLMPKWKAGRQNGRPVSVAYTLPIKFKLD
jgi:periplasmic protein TonB